MHIKIKKAERKLGFGGASLLLSPFAKILGGVIISILLASAGYNVFNIIKVKNLEIKLLKAKNELAHSNSELDRCKTSIDLKNQEILNIKIGAEEDISRFKQVNDQLGTITKVQEREIGRLLTDKAPATCEEAKNWMRDNIKIYEGSPKP